MRLSRIVRDHFGDVQGWRLVVVELGLARALELYWSFNPLPPRPCWWAADVKGVG